MKLLFWLLVWAESHGNPRAVSHANAKGLTQMTPIAVEEVRRMGYPNHCPNLFDREVSLDYGMRYFEYCIRSTHSLEEALMMYNGGFRQVRRHRQGKPLARETAQYWKKISLWYDMAMLEEQ
jgi:soluble lytic murein transglycosylase-like protein